jgi:hypothetical protein
MTRWPSFVGAVEAGSGLVVLVAAQDVDGPVRERERERVDVGGVQREPEDDDAVVFEQAHDVRCWARREPPRASDLLGEILDDLCFGAKVRRRYLGDRDGRTRLGSARVAGEGCVLPDSYWPTAAAVTETTWLNVPSVGAEATATIGKALPPQVTSVAMESPIVRPCAMSGSQARLIGPAIRVGGLHDAPPFVDETKPTRRERTAGAGVVVIRQPFARVFCERPSGVGGSWWGPGEGGMKEGLGRPGHEGDCVVAAECCHVGQPGQGFDAGGTANGQDQLVYRLLG